MNTLKGKTITLRPLEPTDLAFLYQVENNESFWRVSNTQKPYSKFLLNQYLDNASQDIYTAKQLRLLIVENETEQAVGLIDIFDFEPKHKRAGLGILVIEESQNKGFAKQAIQMMLNYSTAHLDLHQLHANISSSNERSIALFEKLGFELAGIKKDWNFSQGSFTDEHLYQRILS